VWKEVLEKEEEEKKIIGALVAKTMKFWPHDLGKRKKCQTHLSLL